MGISRLLAVATVLASAATSSPIARRAVDDEPLSFNPGGPMKPATPTAPDARMSFNPGGPMISATPTHHHHHHSDLHPQATEPVVEEEEEAERIWTPRSPKEEPRGINPGFDDTQAQPSMSINIPPMLGGSGSGSGGRKHSYQTGAAGPPPFWPANPSRPQTRQTEGNDTSAVANGLCPYTLPLPTSAATANPCAWNGVMTVYPSIATSTRQVDCGGCAELSIPRHPINCPLQIINATQSVSTASTFWVTVCSPTAVPTPATHTRMAQGPNIAAPLPTAPALPGAGAPASTLATGAPQWPPAGSPPWPTQFPQRPTGAAADGNNSPPWPTQFPRPTGPDGNPWTGGGFGPFAPGSGGLPPNPFTNMPPGFSPQGGFPFGLPPFFMPGGGCFTPFLVPPHFTGGRTATEYQEVRTTVCDLQCNGCALTTSLAKMAYGQPVRFRTTVTKPYSYTTVYRCAK